MPEDEESENCDGITELEIPGNLGGNSPVRTVTCAIERYESIESGPSRKLSFERVPLISIEDWRRLSEDTGSLEEERRVANKKKTKSLAQSMWSALRAGGNKKPTEEDAFDQGEILPEFLTAPPRVYKI